MAKRVLLKDIAEAANLTINTVSRALKDKEDISEPTRIYVKKLAYEMGYIPDVVASSLRSGYTKTIGIMFDNLSNPYYMIMTDLIHQELKSEGYDIMIFTSSGDNAKVDMESFNKIISRRIDGIISFLKPNKDVVNAIKVNKIPFVIIGREGDDIGIDSVYTNDFIGGYEIGRLFYKKGHKNIGYIGAPKDILCSVKRYEGMNKYFEELNIRLNTSSIKFLNHGQYSLLKYINQLIDEHVTAIFCFNDTIAYEVITILQEKGYRVPLDISVAGYDNIEEYIKLPASLTSIDANKRELTHQTIQTLFNRINDFNHEVVKIVNQARLIERKTA